jgi:predicted nucleic acid-binding protein
MKRSLFLDTNVVLDIVLERHEFLKEARELLLLSDNNDIELFTSALTIAHCAYFAKKFRKDPILTVTSLLKWFEIVDLKRQHFESTILSKFKDFEDGLQFFSANEAKAIDYIITRDINDFKVSTIPVLSPKDFLLTFNK